MQGISDIRLTAAWSLEPFIESAELSGMHGDSPNAVMLMNEQPYALTAHQITAFSRNMTDPEGTLTSCYTKH